MLRNLQVYLVQWTRSFGSCVTAAQYQRSNSTLSNNSQLYGQPTPESHPHLLKPGELTPGITLQEYQKRRRLLLETLSSISVEKFQGKRMVAVIPSASKVYMSEKIPYPFRQNSDFLYLTGFQEPDSVLVLSAAGCDDSNFKSTIFVPKSDPHIELWDGPRTSAETAVQFLGVDEGYTNDDFENIINTLLDKNANLLNAVLFCDFSSISHQPYFERALNSCVKQHSLKSVESPRSFIHKLRVFKSPAEIALMTRSCEIASQAFVKTISSTKPGVTEHDLNSLVEHECKKGGAERLAYPPVIAGGDRATTIHYAANNQSLRNDELVLMDAGCEYHGYVSDITRTWPVSHCFTQPQKELYEALLDTQQALINLCKHCLPLDRLHDKMTELLAINFQQIGLIPKSLSAIEKSKLVSKYCPHHVSHYLGMDVHDTPSIPRTIPLQPGMTFTIEPGVYIRSTDQQAPKDFRGLGMRIEDNILITPNGPLVLSSPSPKTIKDLETLKLNI